MEELENSLFQLYGRSVRISIDEKDIKVGILKPCKFQPLFAEIYIERVKDKVDKIKIPYPFDVETYLEDGLIYLDYRVSKFNLKTKSEFKAEDVSNIIHHKYFDKILTLEVVEDNE